MTVMDAGYVGTAWATLDIIDCRELSRYRGVYGQIAAQRGKTGQGRKSLYTGYMIVAVAN